MTFSTCCAPNSARALSRFSIRSADTTERIDLTTSENSGASSVAKPVAHVDVLARIGRIVRPYWWAVVLAIVSMGLVAAAEAGIPALLKPLIDKGFGTKDPSSSVHWYVPVAIIGLALARGLAQYASGYLLSYVLNRALLDLRLQMFQTMLRAPAAFFQRETASTIINAIVFEVNQVLNVLTNVLVTLVRDSLTVVFLLGYLFYLNWRLTLIVAVILPAIGWLVSKINRRLRRLNREQQMLTNQLSYVVEETVGGYKVVKVHNGEPYEMGRFMHMSRRLRGYAMRVAISGGLAQPLTQFLASIALAVVITIAVIQSANDQTTVGGFVAFVTSMLLVISPLKHLIDVNQPLTRGMTAAELIFGLIDEPVEDAGGERKLDRATGSVEFEQVSFDYGAAQRPTLDDISLKIAPGEMVALAGPSGSGKTTLVNLLPRFFDPTAGRVLIDGVPLPEYRLPDLRKQIAFVSQDVVLFNDTIAANVAYGQPVERERVDAALRAASLTEAVALMPAGIDTLVGDNGMRLSGGQRQRLAIARAIYKDAPILILDEATSALDSESERHVQAALEVLMRGRTTLVIAHRLSTIERADRILVLDGGRIVEEGTHAELLRRDGLYANLHRIQYQQGTA
ncbi:MULTISPECIES: lipid A export permease/ATP-binding protein MsbA [Burkholderiaceae]|uniref:lipid A export permease/ATP-binding protein MsbA n=1 Tax=Burkholderiaceae TaxID=119060 RepID=UPI0011157675|nr:MULTISPECIES: lipid A export permease/ATP-binding protein MsbA [Burkholderiaceae]MCG1039923.1 lipid A export permease/ATP-binding protein MsbA [Mycetohabitans sp. B7]